MTSPSMESIFLILSGAILAAGVLYWFWSHIQLTQKKVQLLENAVFELRSMLQNRGDGPDSSGPVSSGSSSGPAAPEPVYQDLPDDDWDAPAPASASASVSGPVTMSVASPVRDSIASTPLEALRSDNDDLQPGGGAGHGLSQQDAGQDSGSNEQFRELFAAAPPSPPSVRAVAAASDTSLESMPVKELRRLAEQRGITGVSDLKKKELLAALRQQITSMPAATGATGAKEVVVERTLDLTEPETVELSDVPVLE